jgi:hypothetical protein
MTGLSSRLKHLSNASWLVQLDDAAEKAALRFSIDLG